ncbi:GNAT family N-acetyltransferase [Flindersiella endophytica]
MTAAPEVDVAIRPATLTDAAAVTGLLHQLGYPANTVPEVRERLAVWAASPSDASVLVAVAGADGCGRERERVVGVVAVAAVPYLEKPGRWARIVALVVADDARSQGVGRRLVSAAETAARDLGCVATELTSARRRVRAHAFYRANGYQDWTGDVARLFHKHLQPDPAPGPVGLD